MKKFSYLLVSVVLSGITAWGVSEWKIRSRENQLIDRYQERINRIEKDLGENPSELRSIEDLIDAFARLATGQSKK